MTQREGGLGSPGEPADDAAAAEDAAAEASADEPQAVDTGGETPAAVDGESDLSDGAAPEDAAVLGDANDALPTTGRKPRSVVPPPTRGLRGPRRPGAAARPAVAPTPSEIAVRIDDRISALVVIVTVAFFVLLFVYAVLLGGSGLLTPKPTPRPTHSPSPSASASASLSTSASPSASASPSTSSSASASAGPSVPPSASSAPSASVPPSASSAPSASVPPSASVRPSASPSGT